LKGYADSAEALLRPCLSAWMDARLVSGYVNNVRNQGPECIQPVAGLDL